MDKPGTEFLICPHLFHSLTEIDIPNDELNDIKNFMNSVKYMKLSS